jgi:hypothetical protein
MSAYHFLENINKDIYSVPKNGISAKMRDFDGE